MLDRKGDKWKKKDIIVSKSHLTFDEFKNQIDKLSDSKTILDSSADLYDIVPSFIKAIQNFDPTGIAGAIDQALSENKAKREKENIIKALYLFYEAIIYVGNKQSAFETKINEQLSELTYLYFHKSQEVYDNDKIEYYKNIWINGIIRTDNTFEEKAYVFEVVSSLSLSEINALAYIESKHGHLDFDERTSISIDELKDIINVTKQQTQQLCISLAGKGLLHDWGLGRFDYEGPRDFVMTDYVLLIAKYLRLP